MKRLTEIKQPTQEQWNKFFRLKSTEWFESAMAKYEITVDDSLIPFCRAIAHEAFKAGMGFANDNTITIARGSHQKLFKEVLEYQNRTEKIMSMQTKKIQ